MRRAFLRTFRTAAAGDQANAREKQRPELTGYHLSAKGRNRPWHLDLLPLWRHSWTFRDVRLESEIAQTKTRTSIDPAELTVFTPRLLTVLRCHIPACPSAPDLPVVPICRIRRH